MIAVIAGKGSLPVDVCNKIVEQKEKALVISFFPEDNFAHPCC